LSREPENTVRQPDVSYLRPERVARAVESFYFEGAPELAVEVVSPGDSAADLHLKTRQYLEAGAKEVWIAYPSTRSVQVYQRGGREYTANETDSLTTDLFPGWSARVSEFFALG
jgi:Uma2 family endonuclease